MEKKNKVGKMTKESGHLLAAADEIESSEMRFTKHTRCGART